MERTIYESMYAHEQTFWWHCGMRRITRVLLDRFVPTRTGRVLDVGCGTGGMFATLRRYGSVTGIDVSKEAVGFALRTGAADVREGRAEKIPFPDNSFDLININEVLYHREIQDDGAVLCECARVLKPGGVLFVREPALNWLRGSHDTLVWTRHRYTKKELRRALESSGFRVRKSSYANFFLLPVVLVVRLFEMCAKPKVAHADVFKPPRGLNSVFKAILYLEAFLLTYISFPIGVSLIFVAENGKKG